jgi:CBS domain-containing protein
VQCQLFLALDERNKPMNTPIVRDWMHSPAITIPETAPLPAARKSLTDHHIRRLPVLNESGQLVGIVTQGDIFSVSPSHVTDVQDFNLYFSNEHVPVREFMTRDVITATPDMKISDVAQLMLDHKISGLPVVEEGNVTGIITESDIFRLFIRIEREQEG